MSAAIDLAGAKPAARGDRVVTFCRLLRRTCRALRSTALRTCIVRRDDPRAARPCVHCGLPIGRTVVWAHERPGRERHGLFLAHAACIRAAAPYLTARERRDPVLVSVELEVVRGRTCPWTRYPRRGLPWQGT